MLAYGENEAQSIASLVFEDLLGITKIQRLTAPAHPLTDQQVGQLHEAVVRLLRHEPVQHIIGFSHFYERKYRVTRDALIPRPETEELVDRVVRENRSTPALRILDVGTGTGCIAISLAAEMVNVDVTAWDISQKALELARSNAQQLLVKVNFEQIDVLSWSGERTFDLIVSNPPYIPLSERPDMDKNVTDFEPELALFVPDEDPLLFYRIIAGLGKRCLTKSGKLYLEIHEQFGEKVKDLLINYGYTQVTLIRDLHGKDRVVRAYH